MLPGTSFLYYLHLIDQTFSEVVFVLVPIFSALEGAESTMILASGMCASTVMLMALVPAGGHLVTTTDCYRKTRIFIETILPRMGIKV